MTLESTNLNQFLQKQKEFLIEKQSNDDLEWQDLADMRADFFGTPEARDTVRKGAKIINEYLKAGWDLMGQSSDVQTACQTNPFYRKLDAQRDELYILKKQYSDQRREYNKMLDVDARWNNLADRLVDAANLLNSSNPITLKTKNIRTCKKEAVLVFSDWHYGMVTDNIFNKYNVDICKERVSTLVAKAKNYLATHGISVLHVLLMGDAATGAIHCGTRVASEEDTVDQLMEVSELYAKALESLADSVEFLYAYSTYGNHLRTIQNKHDSIHSDNMEKIIPWWLTQRLLKRDDIIIIDSEYYEFIRLKIFGYNICATHGDLDTIKNLGSTMNNIFSQIYGEVINYAIMADKHHLEEFDSFGIESIVCPSLCGTEEYSNIHRLYSKPGQILMIFSEDEGRECTYNIRV